MKEKLISREALSTLIMGKEDLFIPGWFSSDNCRQEFRARTGYLLICWQNLRNKK
jgi:hypothetical protein